MASNSWVNAAELSSRADREMSTGMNRSLPWRSIRALISSRVLTAEPLPSSTRVTPPGNRAAISPARSARIACSARVR